MARGDFKYRVSLEVDDQASPKLDKVQGRFSKLGSFLKDSFTITLGDVIGLLKSMGDALGSIVSAAQAQEDAVTKLDASLSSLGSGAQAVSADLQEQAAALELTTKFADEAIISNQALAINLGVAAGDVGKLTQAAVELSSATGTSLESSFVNLSRTLNGFRGELGELVPEVARLTEEELRSGAALTVIIDRLGGSSAAAVDTFSGRIAQLGNAFGTLKEKLGAALTENEAITDAMDKLRDIMTSPAFIAAVEGFAEKVVETAIGLGELATKADRAREVLTNLTEIFREMFAVMREGVNYVGELADSLTFGLLGKLFELTDAMLDATGATTHFKEEVKEVVENTEDLAAATDKAVPRIKAYSDYTADAAVALEERSTAAAAAADSATALDLITEAAAGSALTYEDAERSLRQETDALTESFDRAASAANRVNSATGGRLTARDRRSQADVDNALAQGRETFQGGTRIRTADGSGSRLVGSRSF